MMTQTQPAPGTGAQRHEQLQDILSVSRAMLDLAQSQNWEGVAGLEPRRRQSIMAFFADAPSLQEAAQVASVIEQVLIIDKEIMSLGRTGLERLGAELRNVGVGRRAHRAYSETAA